MGMADWTEARIAVTFDGDSTEPPTPAEIEYEINDAAQLFAGFVERTARDTVPGLPPPSCSYANAQPDIAANRSTFTIIASRPLPIAMLREALRDACEAEGFRMLEQPDVR